MKCYNCRAEVTEDALFCSKCGSPQKFTSLVQRAMDNDQTATEQLYKMTYNNVYQTICTVASLDNDAVFDLVQNTYVKAFRNLSQLKEPEAFRGWVKIIGRNLTIDYMRKRKSVTFSQMVSVDSDEIIEFEDNRMENLPEVVIDRKETSELLGEILDQLSEEQRIVIHMHYFEDLSVKEIADILDVSEGTVKSRLNYGRKKIEAGVKALEKKGTKLYGLAPIPFLLALFKNQQVYAAEIPNPAILQAVQEGVSSGASFLTGSTVNMIGQEAAKAIGEEAVKTTGAEAGKVFAGAVGKAAFKKAVAGVTAAAVIGTGAAGITSINKDKEIDDFLGGYVSEEYCYELTYTDDTLSVASGRLPYGGMIVYDYSYIKIEDNVLTAKYAEGTDTYILNEDGTVTVTFLGWFDYRDATYGPYEGEGSAFQ